ncbi:hypothetical protein [Spirosoma aerolatum]|uniref:hypothetical protein n=1 Tax=Spirosoma aerolatum TaxID=1211326 RepID=UPI0009AD8964|nr:hypothetical protein [Spirosoma aerolatum]
MPGNAFVRYGLLLLLALPIGFLLLNPQLLRCIWIEHSGHFQTAKGMTNVYISRTATQRQQTKFRQQVIQARSRIQRFWGSQQGRAILIYCPTQADYEQYCAGGEGAGCSIGTPWGSAYLILGPDGNDVDVIAHELCHDELFARLGWWQVKRQIPQWFNEGLALMVDYRYSYPSVWERTDRPENDFSASDNPSVRPYPHHPMLKLSELETTRDFFGTDYMHTMLAYQTAAEEVARWLSRVGHRNVLVLTNAITDGEPFKDAYQRIEKQSR